MISAGVLKMVTLGFVPPVNWLVVISLEIDSPVKTPPNVIVNELGTTPPVTVTLPAPTMS